MEKINKKKIGLSRYGAIPATMMQDMRLNRLDLATYAFISMNVNSEGYAYPSFEYMQAYLSGYSKVPKGNEKPYYSVSRTQLYASIKRLKDYAWITVEDKKYYIHELDYNPSFIAKPRNTSLKKDVTKEVEHEEKKSNVIKFSKVG